MHILPGWDVPVEVWDGELPELHAVRGREVLVWQWRGRGLRVLRTREVLVWERPGIFFRLRAVRGWYVSDRKWPDAGVGLLAVCFWEIPEPERGQSRGELLALRGGQV